MSCKKTLNYNENKYIKFPFSSRRIHPVQNEIAEIFGKKSGKEITLFREKPRKKRVGCTGLLNNDEEQKVFKRHHLDAEGLCFFFRQLFLPTDS